MAKQAHKLTDSETALLESVGKFYLRTKQTASWNQEPNEQAEKETLSLYILHVSPYVTPTEHQFFMEGWSKIRHTGDSSGLDFAVDLVTARLNSGLQTY